MLNYGRIHSFPRSTSFLPNWMFNVQHNLRFFQSINFAAGQRNEDRRYWPGWEPECPYSACRNELDDDQTWRKIPVPRLWLVPSKQGLWTKTAHTGSWLRKNIWEKMSQRAKRAVGFFCGTLPSVVIGPRIPGWRWWLIISWICELQWLWHCGTCTNI